MKENELDKFIEKYKEGDITLEEEKNFFKHTSHSDPSLEAWTTFVNHNKIESPKGFNDKLWKSFQDKRKGKRRLLISVLAVAASIVILIFFIIGNQDQEIQSYAEKEQLLNQALGMFDSFEPKEVQHNVFYENEMIVVYTITE